MIYLMSRPPDPYSERSNGPYCPWGPQRTRMHFKSMLFMQFKKENELDLHFGQVELRASPYSNLHDMQSEMQPTLQ